MPVYVAGWTLTLHGLILAVAAVLCMTEQRPMLLCARITLILVCACVCMYVYICMCWFQDVLCT